MIENIDKIICLALKSTPICLFILEAIKLPFEYNYAKKCETYFNIPYKYFLFDWKNSLLESIKYAFLLTLILAIDLFIFFYRCEYTMLWGLCISFIFLNVLFMLCTLCTNIKINETKKIGICFAISLVVSIIFSPFLVFQISETGFIIALLIYCLGSIILYIYSIVAYFKYFMQPENKMYEIAYFNDNNYFVIDIKNSKYIIKELNANFEFDINSKYQIVDNLQGYTLSFRKIKKNIVV